MTERSLFLRNSRCGFILLSLVICHPVSAQADPELKFRPYGFIRANLTGSSVAVDSFGNTNMSAPTAVSPSSYSNSGLARDTFQVAQSRVGTWIDKGPISGRLEFDFIDFTKATPTTQAVPRIRIANIDYHLDSHQTLSAGQDWDLFSSPDKPFTFNYVGLFFSAGNVGFMRQQVRYAYQFDSGWTFATAIGLQNRNSTASDTTLETFGTPTLSVRTTYAVNSSADLGISAIVSRVRPDYSTSLAREIYGLNTFWSIHTNVGFKLRGQAYFGQNLGSAGTLSLANATTTNSYHEAGGYLSALQPLSERFSLQGGVGLAQVFENGGSALPGLVGNTILWNRKVEVALTYRPENELSFYLQPTFLQTAYVQYTGPTDIPSAILMEGGMVYQF